MTETGADQIAIEHDASRIADLFHAIEDALSGNDAARVKALSLPLRAPDLADIITLLGPNDRIALIKALGDDLDFEVLSELDETVRDQLVEALPNEQLADAMRELDTDDALYVIEDMDEADKDEILSRLPRSESAALKRGFDYPEDSAGRLMQADFIAVPPFWSVGQTIDFMRETRDLPDTFSQIYVVDPSFHLLGIVKLDRLLRTKLPTPIKDIQDVEMTPVLDTSDQEDVAHLFKRYDLISAPVVDENNRMVGVITADDVVEVIASEAEEDIKLLGGVGDESLADSVLSATRSRFIWLLVNLATALLASAVIKLFDATIEQMVALAVLMPIVASMGGNAGTQTMTIAVRALATKELGPLNATRVIIREVSVGLLNGLIFSFIMAMVTLIWLGIAPLSLVIAAAMVFNMIAAALAGILIPLTLDKLGYDPAVASGVFVTTVTDVVGFFAFLGLAALWLH